jgi:5-dehydro-2-deoxygluconokinase
MERLYEIGLVPDWWKLPPSADKPTWRRIGDIIRTHDSHSHGVLLLGLDASDSELATAFAAAAGEPMVRGFAVGRTIFWPVAEKWFAGTTTDAEAIRLLTEACRRVVALWRKVRPLREEDTYFAARSSAISS